jgi:K+-sensing histidine kinase KdpD
MRRGLRWYLDFTLSLIAGLGFLFAAIFGMEAGPVRAPFDIKVAIVCITLAAVCVLLASNKVLVLSCAVITPAALVGYHAFFTKDRQALEFYSVSLVAGLVVMVVAVFAQSLWHTRSSRRSK